MLFGQFAFSAFEAFFLAAILALNTGKSCARRHAARRRQLQSGSRITLVA